MHLNNSINALSIDSIPFSEEFIGRSTLRGILTGRELNKEYVFGLFSELAINADALSLLGTRVSYNTTC